MTTKVRKFGRGVRLVQHGCVLSEVLREPGPTHSVFDLLAASAVALAPGPRFAMLGFAGGGMIAPLRKLGGEHTVEAVDLDAAGYSVYQDVVGSWGGEVTFSNDDAVKWLRGQRGRFDVIVEDLSVPQGKDVVKPAVSWETLPPLMAKRVRKSGVVITNLLPTPGMSLAELERRCRGGGRACVVEMDRFHNRILLQGDDLGSARELGRRLRELLTLLGSRLAGEISVRALRT